MPKQWVIRVRVPTATAQAKPIYSRPLTYTAAKQQLKLWRGRGHKADIVELTAPVRAEIERQTL